ncbi:hypothetical protein BACI71_120059 [Bacillus mycoides]|uniref:Uncharacterized protein n=1 Tax=Bacillus mycoides TaxID=1405 RepID=A0A653SCW1_BACMY|nr:hypothetical protein BACI71_120059 [Bacillus mycoides]
MVFLYIYELVLAFHSYAHDKATKRIQILKRKKGDKHERLKSTTRKSITTITRARCNN